MLRTLYIRDYALIEELEVTFGAGMNVITGETGAGKSIIIGALKMILGERASTEVIRTGARKAIIEGVFDNTDTPRIRKLLQGHDLDPAGQIILRREISQHQSRAFINDTPATLPVIREVANQVIDLHGQHEHQLLLRTETHVDMLDDFGGLGALRDTYQEAYENVASLIRERETLLARQQELAQQQELYGFQIEEIDRVEPEPDEEERLETERLVLENAERLHEMTAQLYLSLYEADNAVHDQLGVAVRDLDELAGIDPEFLSSLEEARSAKIVVAELAQQLQAYNEGIEFNPERLESVRSRLGDLENLKRKYGGTLEAVLAYRHKIGEQYAIATDADGSLATLNEQIDDAQTYLAKTAEELSAKRKKTAKRVEQAIVAELERLGMPDSRFDVRFAREPSDDGWIQDASNSDVRFTAFTFGVDQVEFYISTNLGEEVKPLARVASGGEISRIMLALKSILARNEQLPILVFDEIDAGISGPIARKVGKCMHELAQSHQIIAITHLPQIASLGDIHFLVEKETDGSRTKTQIERLSDEERMNHVASLISGAQVTEAALQSARELIANGHRVPTS